MFRKVVLVMLGLGLVLSACGNSGSGNDAGPLVHVKVPLGYIPNIQFAPLYVALEKGYFKDAGIDIEFDYSFAPADLKGKRIGLPGLFGANYIGLDALLFSAGLSEADVTLDSIGFNQIEALATDQEQAVSVYAANEPIQLRAQGYELNEILVADHVQLASNGLITNEKTIAENPDLVRRMVSVIVKGLKDTMANPDEAYKLSKKHIPDLTDADQPVQMQVLTRTIELWKTDRIGYSDPKAWENMHDLLLNMKLLKEPLDVSKAFTNEFVP